MPITPNTNTFRRMVSIMVVLTLLSVFLSIYFLKYVPDQRSDYNRRAFVELGSVINAFNKRDSAFLEVVNNFNDTSLDQMTGIFRSPVSEGNCDLKRFLRDPKVVLSRSVAPLLTMGPTQQWSLFYTLTQRFKSGKTPRDTGTCILRFEKPVDELMHPLVRGDVDVFDSYLMIIDSSSFHPSANTEHLPKGEIIFNSGQLALDYTVNIDTLLKKSDGFSLPGINDVNIEGNDFKLFLRPFRLHGYKAILAGLLSRPHYTQRYESVPIAFVTTGAILLMLLFIALPIIKIYIIGAYERITNLDLRMIIGTYFVGAFVLFFLYNWNFLKSTETRLHKEKLGLFAMQLQKNLTDEIHATCTQLKTYDTLYRSDGQLRRVLTAKNYDSAAIRPFETRTTNSLHPKIYRQFDVVFWVNNDGRVAARYALMHYHDLPLISIRDREYFQDMKATRTLLLPGYNDRFCLQPTLDKLDGRFVMNLVIPRPIDPANKDTAIMLGAFGQPYSVYNTAIPSGYGYSIVDNRGIILFDSRNGRHLLSDIYTDINDDESIAQCIDFRKERFFASTNLHGDKVALLVTPIVGLPYTVLVYDTLGTTDKFQLYILGLSCFFIASIILLLIFSAFCNEWSRAKTSLSGVPRVNFQWLRPRPGKVGYYRALSGGMLRLVAAYSLIWCIFELTFPRTEFFLFVTSVLFPFDLAIFYFLLRERQNQPHQQSFWKRAPKPALAVPAMAIFVTLIYLSSQKIGAGNFVLVIAAQLLFAGLIGYTSYRFHRRRDQGSNGNTLRLFSRAVIIGVLAIVTLPATGIFSFFYKAETRTRNKEEMLNFATDIAARRDGIAINKDSVHYSLYPGDSSDAAFLNALKYRLGVYYVNSPSQKDQLPEEQSSPYHHPSMYYNLRNFLYPDDTTIVTFGDNPDVAGDSSWYFLRTKMDSELLVHTNISTGKKDSVLLPLAPAARTSALKLLLRRTASLGAMEIEFFILSVIVLTILTYYLTQSLATRIFLLRILCDYPDNLCLDDPLKDTRPEYPDCSLLAEKMTAEIGDDWSADLIRAFEERNSQYILHVQTEFKERYRSIWAGLTAREKFVLYDFAVDDIANYRSGAPLFSLIRKGILRIDRDNQLLFMTRSFHDFVLNRSGSNVITEQMKMARTQGSWNKLKLPFLLVVAAAGIFVFLTQDAVYQRITGLLTSLGSIVPLITQFFDNRNK